MSVITDDLKAECLAMAPEYARAASDRYGEAYKNANELDKADMRLDVSVQGNQETENSEDEQSVQPHHGPSSRARRCCIGSPRCSCSSYKAFKDCLGGEERFLTLLSVLLCTFICVLTGLLVFAGYKPNRLPNLYLISFNTSDMGRAIKKELGLGKRSFEEHAADTLLEDVLPQTRDIPIAVVSRNTDVITQAANNHHLDSLLHDHSKRIEDSILPSELPNHEEEGVVIQRREAPGVVGRPMIAARDFGSAMAGAGETVADTGKKAKSDAEDAGKIAKEKGEKVGDEAKDKANLVKEQREKAMNEAKKLGISILNGLIGLLASLLNVPDRYTFYVSDMCSGAYLKDDPSNFDTKKADCTKSYPWQKVSFLESIKKTCNKFKPIEDKARKPLKFTSWALIGIVNFQAGVVIFGTIASFLIIPASISYECIKRSKLNSLPDEKQSEKSRNMSCRKTCKCIFHPLMVFYEFIFPGPPDEYMGKIAWTLSAISMDVLIIIRFCYTVVIVLIWGVANLTLKKKVTISAQLGLPFIMVSWIQTICSLVVAYIWASEMRKGMRETIMRPLTWCCCCKSRCNIGNQKQESKQGASNAEKV